MKKNLKWLGFGGALMTTLLFAANLPAKDFRPSLDWRAQISSDDDLVKSCMATVKKDCESWAAAGGGGEAPRGLQSDTKVELALGERYALTGTILIHGGDAYLKVDFTKAPWLASRTRTRNPYYRIDDSVANWIKYRGETVTVVGIAKYAAYTAQGRAILEIYLKPAAEKAVIGIRR
jgi:hypothetical protein